MPRSRRRGTIAPDHTGPAIVRRAGPVSVREMRKHMTKFSDLNLSPKVLKAIEEAGYDSPTPIQAGAIPPALEGKDVLGIAQTGTGKTASFTLPMITQLARGRARARMPRSLVLCPTRELAAQVAENFDTYAKHVKLSKALLIGGVSFGEQDKLIDARNDAIEEVRKYYAGLYRGAGDSDVPDVHEAVRQIADEPPATRDASHDAETTATTRDAGPEPEPDARSVDFERLVDQAEEPRKVIGSAMDVSDEDLAEARARDAREAAEGQPAMWMGYAIHELEVELTQDSRGYEKAFLVAREEWQNEKLRREAEAAVKKPDPVAT